MRLFWRYGYAGVSISDLTSAIGIAPPSLYAAFGNKAGLYREALDRYSGLPGARDGMIGATSLEMAVSGLLEAAIHAVTSEAEERGCMISTGMVEREAEQVDLAQELANRRRQLRDDIAEALSPWLDGPAAGRLAVYLLVVQQGMSVQARDGATSDELKHVADEVVAGIHARVSNCEELNRKLVSLRA